MRHKTNHSPEPWKVKDLTEIWGDINNSVSGDFIQHRFLPEDARRIVACVNACAGITTEELENVGLGNLKNFLEADE